MAVTAFDGQFSFKQDSLARLGQRDTPKMTQEQFHQFQNSPFMQGMRKTEDLCWKFTTSRDEKRASTDPSFRPQDSDFDAPKTHNYERIINYYKVLGVDEYATLDEVKKAYKKLSLVYHPDKTAGLSPEQKEEYAGIFIELKNAYLTLSDNPTRRQYDRDRDRDKASFEVNGFKVKKKAHFDATEVLKKLQEMQKPAGKLVDVPVEAKLEKFFFGGHKGIKRNRRVKDFSGFRTETKIYRVDIPRGASEPHECAFRQQGDHNEDTRPDTLNFKIKSKPHELVERVGNDLALRHRIGLGTEAHKEPYLSAEAPSVRGRHLLLWGRNPFFCVSNATTADLRVRVVGEGMPPNGALTFTCRLGVPASKPAPSASSSKPATASRPSPSPAAASAGNGNGNDQVVILVKHMQTDAKLYIRVPRGSTMAEVRAQITSVLTLPRGSTVRLLHQVQGGYTPYLDKQPLGDLRSLNCAGTAWHGVIFNPEKSRQFLQDVIKASDSADFKAALSAAHRAGGQASGNGWKLGMTAFGSLTHILPSYGLEPSLAVMQERVAAALVQVERLADGAKLREKIAELTRSPEPASAPATASTVASGARGNRDPARPSAKRFLERHKLGPPGGFACPGSDTEDEQALGVAARQAGSSMSSSATCKHGQGGLCDAPALHRRAARNQRLVPACEVELQTIGEPITLSTRPTCTITFYSNGRQQRRVASGLVPARPMFAVVISSPPCARKAGAREWDVLKAKVVPLLQLTAFQLLKAARTILPRSIANEPAFAGEAELDPVAGDVEDGLFASLEGGASEDVRVRLAVARQERRAFARRRAALERRLAASEGAPVPWKRLGDEAFRREDYYTALLAYSRCLDGLVVEEAAEDVAIVLSNRAACLAKVRQFEDSLADARRALELRPKWGRAWSRAGLAASCLGKAEEALEGYSKAIEFDPSAANVEALFNLARKAHQPSADNAHQEKEKGNEAMRVNEYGLAVAHYTLGIAQVPPEYAAKLAANEPDEHALLRSVLHSNRAAALGRLRHWEAAASDAQKAVAYKDDFAKARIRLGMALLGCGLVEQAYTEFARASQLEPQNPSALKGRQACLALLPTWRSKVARQRFRDRFGLDLTRPRGSTQVYAISDVHFDHKCNEEWAHRIDDFKFQEDVLIVAGNLTDSRNALARALVTLKAKFRRVFYVPGNHEMWVHPGETTKYPDSISKLLGILELCDELGVDCAPAAIAEDVFVVPMFSWYHAEFDQLDPFPDPANEADKHCKWPMDPETQVWKYMLKLNEAHLRHPYHGTVITFSHFLPLRSLPHAQFGKAAKAMGCEDIDEQARSIRLRSRVHVYGHSHRKHAQFDNGILYVNHYHGQEGGQEDRAPVFLIHDGKEIVKREVDIYDGPGK